MQEKRRYSTLEPYPSPTHSSTKPKQTDRRNSIAAPSLRKKKNTVHADAHGNYSCTECCKAYKHPYCLTKHSWEHSDYWEEVSSLKLSKHQTVQIMEAAQILMEMGIDEE